MNGILIEIPYRTSILSFKNTIWLCLDYLHALLNASPLSIAIGFSNYLRSAIPCSVTRNPSDFSVLVQGLSHFSDSSQVSGPHDLLTITIEVSSSAYQHKVLLWCNCQMPPPIPSKISFHNSHHRNSPTVPLLSSLLSAPS